MSQEDDDAETSLWGRRFQVAGVLTGKALPSTVDSQRWGHYQTFDAGVECAALRPRWSATWVSDPLVCGARCREERRTSTQRTCTSFSEWLAANDVVATLATFPQLKQHRSRKI